MIKRLLAISVVLFSTALPVYGGVTFVEYEAATEMARDLAANCRREIRGGGGADRCEVFHRYLDERYEPLSDAFMERFQRDGDQAFLGVDNVRMQQHIRSQERLTRDIHYISDHFQY